MCVVEKAGDMGREGEMCREWRKRELFEFVAVFSLCSSMIM